MLIPKYKKEIHSVPQCLSGSRICHCHCRGPRSIPGLGTSTCHGCCQKGGGGRIPSDHIMLRHFVLKMDFVGIPIVAQRKQIQLVPMRTWVPPLALLSGLRLWCFHELPCRSDPTLLWLWPRLAAIALIQPLAWKLPYAVGAAIQRKWIKKIRADFVNFSMCFIFLKNNPLFFFSVFMLFKDGKNKPDFRR